LCSLAEETQAMKFSHRECMMASHTQTSLRRVTGVGVGARVRPLVVECPVMTATVVQACQPRLTQFNLEPQTLDRISMPAGTARR
jgi:hypothetical protein